MSKKTFYIRLISNLSDRYGDKLINMLNYYNKKGLKELSENEVIDYYKNIRKDNINNMIKYTDECCSCGLPCLGNECNLKNVPHYYCDECGEEFQPDEIYLFDDGHLCRWCLLDNFKTVESIL